MRTTTQNTPKTMNEIFTALIMGLTGSVHCLTMCGSLSVALGFSIPKQKSFWQYALFVSIGRVLGYGIIGVLANLLTQSIVVVSSGAVFYLSMLSGVLMIGIGMHIANITHIVTKLEKLGTFINVWLAPLKQKLMPIDSMVKCLAYGLLWGFLPCGLVYTALSLAIVSPSPMTAFSVMTLFGLATLPAVVGMTVFSKQLSRIFGHKYTKTTLGLIITFAGLYQIHSAFYKLTALTY